LVLAADSARCGRSLRVLHTKAGMTAMGALLAHLLFGLVFGGLYKSFS
jgi:hypothetical protein